jgi:hypothetical protein
MIGMIVSVAAYVVAFFITPELQGPGSGLDLFLK